MRIHPSARPIPGSASPGFERLIQPDPENGARGSYHGIPGRTHLASRPKPALKGGSRYGYR